jgi:hypothetical protein
VIVVVIVIVIVAGFRSFIRLSAYPLIRLSAYPLIRLSVEQNSGTAGHDHDYDHDHDHGQRGPYLFVRGLFS